MPAADVAPVLGWNKSESLAFRAYDFVLRLIAKTPYEQARELTEVDLAKEIGVSRTPVREAVRRLLSERLIGLNASGRIIVPALTEADIQEAFSLRAALEGVVTGAAASRITPAAIARLREIAVLVDHNVAQHRNDRLIALNTEFHGLILETARMRIADQMLQLTSLHFARFRQVTAIVPEIVRPSLQEHEAIVHALDARDAVLAEELARKHVLRLRDAYLECLRSS